MASFNDTLVIVPARGGSTGIPRKNIKSLGGIPLIGWCSKALSYAGMDGIRTILSTDDTEIADCGRKIGFDVPFLRPANISTGTANLVDVAIHAIDWLLENENVKEPDIVLILLPTQPFRDPKQLRHALDLFDDPKTEGVMSVYNIHRSPGVMFYIDKYENLTPLGKRVKTEQRQQVKPIFTPSGCFFYLRVNALRSQQTLYPNNVRAVVSTTISNIDIDSPEDWAIAEAVFNAGITWNTP